MIRKLLLCPWFGPLPEWFPLWEANIARLEPHGYDVLRVHDIDWFKQRVFDVLDIDAPIVPGEGKIHDYRCAFGLLFEPEIEGYDFWGHTDFDMVYGRVEHFITDHFLNQLDLHSNHNGYVSGPWSLYRTDSALTTLFRDVPDWQGHLENPRVTGWVETVYSKLVDYRHKRGQFRRVYTSWQTKNLDNFDSVRFDNDRLMEGDREIMVAHFRRTKEYPAGCK